MALRAQVSLLFTDKDMYDSFIIPYKDARELNSLIVKCLTAYYYDEKVRGLIEGQQEDIASDTDKASTQQDMINNIRQNLMIQSFMAQEMQQTLADGIDDVSDILHNVNRKAEETGVVRRTEDAFSSGVYQLETEKTPSVPNNQSSVNYTSNNNTNEELVVLRSILERLLVRVGDTEGMSMLNSLKTSNVETTEKTESLNNEVQDVSTDIKEEEFFEEVAPQVEETQLEVEEEPKEIDATASMLELFGSI